MFRNSRLVGQPCHNYISIIEYDLQDAVEAPLREFRHRCHTIEVAADRMTGCLFQDIYVECGTAFRVAKLFVNPIAAC